MWQLFQGAIPGMVRAQRVDSNVPAVIVAETMTPHQNHRFDVVNFTIEIPVMRMPDGLSEHPHMKALRRACEQSTWAYSYVLGVSETWGGPSYTFTISTVVEKDA